jgi:hypothetical protein
VVGLVNFWISASTFNCFWLTRLDLHPIVTLLLGKTYWSLTTCYTLYSFDDICVTIIIVPERRVYNNNRNSNKIFSRKSVCAFVRVSDFFIQPQDVLMESSQVNHWQVDPYEPSQLPSYHQSHRLYRRRTTQHMIQGQRPISWSNHSIIRMKNNIVAWTMSCKIPSILLIRRQFTHAITTSYSNPRSILILVRITVNTV